MNDQNPVVFVTNQDIKAWRSEEFRLIEEREKIDSALAELRRKLEAASILGAAIEASPQGRLYNAIHPNDQIGQNTPSMPDAVLEALKREGPMTNNEIRDRLKGQNFTTRSLSAYYYTVIKRLIERGAADRWDDGKIAIHSAEGPDRGNSSE
ncbi:MAG: hypothetical protein HOB82_01785 [Alphaproteobacteria bacterium]|jgi:hypothetical protein|nr:hypothetical protein [Alphaproteobacteria bacterium]MBT5860151.1 hypothetical protein [Alphaproteobacteria bacterium]